MMGYAINSAQNSVENNRHGCIIARGSRVIAEGWNKSKTHPAATIYDTGHMHAELSAIVASNKSDLVGSDLFVCRILRRPANKTSMSKPCKHCRRLIKEAGIRRVFYTTKDGSIEIEKI